MKKIALIAAVFIMISGLCFAADPCEGFWVSVDDKSGKLTGGWELYVSGGKLLGKVLSLADKAQDSKAVKCKDSYKDFPVAGKVNEMTIVGTPWMFGLNPDKKPGSWTGGNILDAGTGHLYKCKAIFHPADGKKFLTDTLEMRGEIGLGIGRSQYWRKSTREEASGLR
jgi:uncharacterized protein (DUF2147 family)